MSDVRKLYLKIPRIKNLWIKFLNEHGLNDFSESEVQNLDLTMGLYENEKLIGTGSLSDNILKFIAVDEGDPPGANFNRIITALQNELMQQGKTHMMVFTKPQYEKSFNYVGFNTLAKTSLGVLLEAGAPDIKTYLTNLPGVKDQKQAASIVMNANPFTLGHRYLVEQAASENAVVNVFVVSADRSLFSSSERMQLVKEGLADLKNVRVFFGGSYMVSYATFPSYFLPAGDEIIRYQTTLDARLFRDQVAPILNITKRYLGDEPFSRTTNIYNQVLQQELPPSIEVIIVKRLEKNQKIVNATAVRQAIAKHNLDSVKDFLPSTTAQFIEDHESELLARIKKGTNIRGN
ncbi:[citrate (pro-3S)-lyase] ligase [Xylocopilactobacillus apis]|uniref:[Citrate [pro-3S]-lyase] ligase n=1 Tax=Xylocopilactobacillus apis TaxID=2932183 RepID=A0AAU9DQN3_9LACO|nr:[citrate (pro-3S)-lyase] ligase [Xylocopilactobacillus apis]BDR55908.1 [Citrate [pro-3S]-lyase] ligase [Xylocopilactobacillus apis]